MVVQCNFVDRPQSKLVTFKQKIGILIPAFNEAQHLAQVLAACRAIQPRVVLVIDDASTDQTARVLEREVNQSTPQTRILYQRNPYNLGKQGSVRRGLQLLEDHDLAAVALIDGDGQHDPAELPALASLLDHFHVVIGARLTAHMPWERRLSNSLVNLGYWVIGGVNFVDVQSGLRLYRKPLADILGRKLPLDGGYSLEHESLSILVRHAQEQGLFLRIAAAEASCAYGAATSSMHLGHIFQLGCETIRQAHRIRQYTMRSRPSRVRMQTQHPLAPPANWWSKSPFSQHGSPPDPAALEQTAARGDR